LQGDLLNGSGSKRKFDVEALKWESNENFPSGTGLT